MYLAIVEPHAALYRYLLIAKSKGYSTLVLTHDASAMLADESHYYSQACLDNHSRIDRVIECDLSSAQGIIDAITPLRDEIAGIVPAQEIVVPQTYAAGKVLGFDCATGEDAESQHVKSAMKERFAAHGVPTPAFHVARTFEEAEKAWHALGEECIIKMVDFNSAVNVYMVNDLAGLRDAWETITTNRLGLDVPVNLANWVLLEEYVQGREISAEGYVSGDNVTVLNYCEKITSEHFQIIGHYIPADLDAAERAAVNNVADRCVRALGIRNSVFHMEAHIRDGTPYVIECAARPPGMHIAELVPEVYDLDLLDISIDLAVGKPVTVAQQRPQRYYAVLSLHATHTGTLTGVEGLEELHQRCKVWRLFLPAQAGEHVSELTDFRSRLGYVVLEEPTAQRVREQADWVRHHVRINVKPIAGVPA